MQSSNDNNNFLFYGVTEGSNSGLAPFPGPLSPNINQPSPNTTPSHQNDNPPTFPALLPYTPTPANIGPRDGIINYLIYQGLLAPDLSLTSPADLNTMLANRGKPIPVIPNQFQCLQTLLTLNLTIIPFARLIFQPFPIHQFRTTICHQHVHIHFFPRILLDNQLQLPISIPV